jgi:DNA helicase-2/ATP-dependent DNA helicase PcrA
MQAIYPDSIGNIDAYKGYAPGGVREVKKEQNRRNPRLVYELANKLRTDGLIQHHSDDQFAPNMQGGMVKDGCVQFLYSKNNDLDQVRDFLSWSGEIKELNLTHNLIAKKAGFRSFMNVYDGNKILAYVKRVKDYIRKNGIPDDFSEKSFQEVLEFLNRGKSGKELKKLAPTKAMSEYIDENEEEYQEALKFPFSQLASLYVVKEHFLDDKKNDINDLSRPGSLRDNLIKHLFKIQNTIYYYQENMIYEFLNAIDFKITSIDDKKKLKKIIGNLVDVGEKSIGEVIEEADRLGICRIDDKLNRFQKDKEYLYHLVLKIPFSDFQNVYKYLEGQTPFSTQHKTKGSEYENVLVVLDNGKWSHYNFVALFEETGTPSVLERTQKIFYVCCTRAKERLAVFFHAPPSSVIEKAKEWFGSDNVVDLDQI